MWPWETECFGALLICSMHCTNSSCRTLRSWPVESSSSGSPSSARTSRKSLRGWPTLLPRTGSRLIRSSRTLPTRSSSWTLGLRTWARRPVLAGVASRLPSRKSRSRRNARRGSLPWPPAAPARLLRRWPWTRRASPPPRTLARRTGNRPRRDPERQVFELVQSPRRQLVPVRSSRRLLTLWKSGSGETQIPKRQSVWAS